MTKPTHGLLGFECIKLDPDPRAPYRMTVDIYEHGDVMRYQLTGQHYEGRKRELKELADVQLGTAEERLAIAEKLDALDREYGFYISKLVAELQEAQMRVLRGETFIRRPA